MSDPSPQVLVVGAGPTGLLLAAELERRGVPCLLIDALDPPQAWDRATVVHARSVEIFEALGVEATFLAEGVRTRAARFRSDGEVLGELSFAASGSRYGFDIGLSEEVTESVLTDFLEAQGGAVTRSTRLIGVVAGEDSVTATLERDGERREVVAQWLAGCDGLHSAVRAAAGSRIHRLRRRGAVGGLRRDHRGVGEGLRSRIPPPRHPRESACSTPMRPSGARSPSGVVSSGANVETAYGMTEAGERAERDAEIRRTFADPDTAHHEAAAAAEIDRSYPRSRAVAGDDGSDLRPGLRLPDTRDVEPVNGDPRPLHELTHRRGHTLVVIGGPQADPGRVAEVVTELEGRSDAAVDAVVGLATRPGGPPVGRIEESVAARLGVVGVTVLAVRPDRYIGFRDDAGDPRAVEAYLEALVA